MRVLVCGSRDADGDVAYNVLDIILRGIEEVWGIDLLIHGAARGVDSVADEWARMNFAPVKAFPADWKKYGKRAGIVRNQQMLDQGGPKLVVALVNKPLAESRGTADMVRRAREQGYATWVVEA